jgi:hypothetical protein
MVGRPLCSWLHREQRQRIAHSAVLWLARFAMSSGSAWACGVPMPLTVRRSCLSGTHPYAGIGSVEGVR